MTSKRPVNLAIEYVEWLNRRNSSGLAEIKSPDHRLLPAGKDVLQGRAAASESLSGYVSSWPEFQIHISDVDLDGNTVALVARTTGSCVRLSRGEEVRDRRLYVAKDANGLVAEFRVYGEDTPPLREALGVTSVTKITALTNEPLRELWSRRTQGQHEGND
jgi:hypothetical protein